MGSGEKFEKNVTAIPRQFGYLETGRAMYEYAFYKDEEVAHARGLSTSLGTLPILQESHSVHLSGNPSDPSGIALSASGQFVLGRMCVVGGNV